MSVVSRWRGRLKKRRAKFKVERRETSTQLAEEKTARDDVEFAERVIERHRRTQAYLAIQFAKSKLGEKELPANSNRGVWIDKFAAAFTTARGFSWCGAFVGWALKKAGVPGLTERILYVPHIIEDAKHCRNGFQRWVPDPRHVKAGDLVCMDFGSSRDLGEHVGMATGPAFRVGESWYVPTVEGNTSSSDIGSQSNGGMVAARSRPISCIVGCARPAWRS